MSKPKDETSKVNYINNNINLFLILNIQKKEDFTIVVLGKGTVGKTSLIFRYIKNSYPEDHDPTIEDCYTTQMTMSSGEERNFKILDTAGEDDFQGMIDEWIKVADGFLLVYAINDKESFEALKLKVNKIKKNKKDKAPVVVVGNKCDLESKREVDKQIAENYAKSIGAKYYETSALTDENKNCKVVFQQCAHMVVSKFNLETNSKPCPCTIY